MEFKRLLPAMALSICSFISYATLPPNYDVLPNEQKQDTLWENIRLSHQENALPELSKNSFFQVLAKLKGLFNLSPTFSHFSDEIPDGRIKIIHANGSVGKIYFQPVEGHPFTGIYQSGAIGLARLSVATTPDDKSFTPGMAVKLMVFQQPSRNLQIMYRLEGQDGDWNFFSHDFSNIIPHATAFTLKAVERIFEWTKKPANELPLFHLAVMNDKGETVEEPVYPEQLFFRPSERVQSVIPGTSRIDFRTSLETISFGPLYEVYGLYKGQEYHVATLMLESPLLASEYGDKKLFFQHQR